MRILILLGLLGLGGGAGAEVTPVAAGGFDIALAGELASAPPAEAFARFTAVGRWWIGAHSYSGDAGRLSLDTDCLCERWEGNRVRHLEVAQYRPGRLLRLLGGLGPLQGLPVTGVMDVGFAPREEGGSTVTLAYAVRGAGLEGWAEPVHAVLSAQFAAFLAFARSGAADP